MLILFLTMTQVKTGHTDSAKGASSTGYLHPRILAECYTDVSGCNIRGILGEDLGITEKEADEAES